MEAKNIDQIKVWEAEPIINSVPNAMTDVYKAPTIVRVSAFGEEEKEDSTGNPFAISDSND